VRITIRVLDCDRETVIGVVLIDEKRILIIDLQFLIIDRNLFMDRLNRVRVRRHREGEISIHRRVKTNYIPSAEISAVSFNMVDHFQSKFLIEVSLMLEHVVMSFDSWENLSLMMVHHKSNLAS